MSWPTPRTAEALIAEARAAAARHRGQRAPDRIDGAMMARLPEARDRLDLRRRLRQHRCQVCGRARHRRHQHAGGAERGGRRHRARAACSARCANSRRPSAILRAGKWMREALSADAGDVARPHRRHGRHGPHRPGHRAAARRLQACRWSITAAIRRPACAYKHYPKLVDMARDVDTLLLIMPGGAADPASDQRRGARGARAARASSSTWRAARWWTSRR